MGYCDSEPGGKCGDSRTVTQIIRSIKWQQIWSEKQFNLEFDTHYIAVVCLFFS